MRFSDEGPRIRNVRSLFISDLHLGCKHSQAKKILKFLEAFNPEYLYLVGDIIDGRSLYRRWCWQPEFTDVLTQLFKLADQGTVVRYAIGNHDEFLRDRASLEKLESLGRLEIAEEFVHVTGDARQFLVIHGDRFDEIETSAVWVSKVASCMYEFLLTANKLWMQFVDKEASRQYSLSNRIKQSAKAVVKYISDFELKVIEYARQLDCHGAICGHIHTPTHSEIQGLTYCNTGDWVENCTALVELECGQLELVYVDRPASLSLKIPSLNRLNPEEFPQPVSAASSLV